MPPMTTPDDLASNMPNASLMYSTYTPMFGNLLFNLAPSQTGEVNFNFGVMPYMSLEGLIYMQQVAAAVQPNNVTPGQSAGQTNLSGSITQSDASGTTRYLQGTQSNG